MTDIPTCIKKWLLLKTEKTRTIDANMIHTLRSKASLKSKIAPYTSHVRLWKKENEGHPCDKQRARKRSQRGSLIQRVRAQFPAKYRKRELYGATVCTLRPCVTASLASLLEIRRWREEFGTWNKCPNHLREQWLLFTPLLLLSVASLSGKALCSLGFKRREYWKRKLKGLSPSVSLL